MNGVAPAEASETTTSELDAREGGVEFEVLSPPPQEDKRKTARTKHQAFLICSTPLERSVQLAG
jgi:hypothetical protein